MRITILAVGKIKNRAIATLIDEYAGRIRHDATIDISEVGDSDPEHEGKRLLESIGRIAGPVYVLSEEGGQFRSEEFARLLIESGDRATFVVGGPSGLAESVKKAGRRVMSLSKMTFPHELARLLLVEQIYRALSIIHRRNYHR